MSSNYYGGIAGEIADDGDEAGRDYWQEYKDGVAMGYINEDGSPREPREPDWEALAYHEHIDREHGGAECNCPPAPPIEPAQPGDPDYAEEAPF
jgi:hypothetical protein